MLKRLCLALLVAMIPTAGFGQTTVLQGGSFTGGYTSFYSASGGSQPIIQQAPGAGGGLQSIKEMSIVKRGNGTAPFVGGGGGYLGSTYCMYDAPPTNSAGGHQLCFDPNATGGFGMLSFNSFGGASDIPLKFVVNGSTVEFPFSTSGVVGPGSSTVGHIATWANTSGTLLADGGAIPVTGAAGSNGQIQYNNAGAFGGFTMAGDCTLTQPNITCTKVNGETVSLGGALTTAAAFTQAGAFATTLTSVGATNVTLPQTGTLSTLAGAEALTNKSINGMTITPSTGTFSLTNGKTLTVSNTLTLSGTDASTLNIGTGGTLGTAAFTATSAYIPSGTQITNSLSGDVSLNNTSTYFDGPSVAQGSTGTWFCSGTVVYKNAATFGLLNIKLWDGTNVAASAYFDTSGLNATQVMPVSISGYISSPAGNMRISVKDTEGTSGALVFNQSGNSKDSTISCFRVQ
jgi:hypothetical protein